MMTGLLLRYIDRLYLEELYFDNQDFVRQIFPMKEMILRVLKYFLVHISFEPLKQC